MDDEVQAIIDGLIKQKILEMHPLEKKDQFVLVNEFAFSSKFVSIILPGYPEKAAIWSQTLLQMGKRKETSMEKYFTAFTKKKWGLIALTPHYIQADAFGVNYRDQLVEVLGLLPTKAKIGLICFSFGGSALIDYLEEVGTIKQLKKIALLDPVPPIIHKKVSEKTKKLLAKKAILFAARESAKATSHGIQTGEIIGLKPKISKCIHGELPTKVLKKVLTFFEE